MSIRKRFTAAVIACVMFVLTLAGCGSDTAVAATIDGSEIAAGVYIQYLLEAYGDATDKIAEEQPELDMTAADFNVMTYTVEGKAVPDWIEEKALEKCKYLVAVEKYYDELGLSFTEEETTQINNHVASTWDDVNEYLAYYGINFDTMGKYYESLGVSRTSFKRVYTATYMKEAIFNKLYDEGGLEAVSKEEIDAYAQENYAIARYFEIELVDGTGEDVTTEEGLQILKDLGNTYVDDIASGKTMGEVKAKYDRYVKEQEIAAAMKEAEDAGEEYDGEKLEEIEIVTVEDDTLEKLCLKTSTYPSEAFVEKLFSISEEKPVFFEDEDAYYVMVRCSQADNYDKIEVQKGTIIHSIKDEAFEARIAERYAAYSVDTVQKSIERYSAEAVCK